MNQVILPEEHKYLTFLKKVLRHEFRRNGFRRISIDLLEDGKLRKCSEKGIMNAYLEYNIEEQIQPFYYYIMGRFLNNQKQEYRITGEILGENDPILDAIMIFISYTSFNKIGLAGKFNIRINSFGVEKEQIKYKEELMNFYSDKKHLLTKEGLEKLDKNILDLLISQEEDEKILAQSAPNIMKFLKKDSKNHYLKFKEYLDLLNVSYIEDPLLFPTNSYNTNTVWSIDTIDGNINLAYGARYNALSKELGYPKEVPASGFYIKTNKIIEFLMDQNIKIKDKDSLDLFIIQLGDEAKKIVLPISLQAREAGINTIVSLGTPSIKEQMLKAQRSGAKYIVIVGLVEARNGIFQLRDIEAGTQEEIKKDELIDYIIDKIGKDSLNFYSPARDLLTN